MSSPDQRLVERALADLLGGFVAERIVAVLLQRLAQRIQDLPERALAGAVAEKAVVVLQFDIEAVDVDRRQPGRAVPGDAGGRQCVLSHFAPAMLGIARTTAGEPVGFTEGTSGEWEVANGSCFIRNSPLAIRHGFGQNRHIWRGFRRRFALTRGRPGYKSPHPARDFLALFVFARL